MLNVMEILLRSLKLVTVFSEYRALQAYSAPVRRVNREVALVRLDK
jgi:hypothetical protein